MKTYYGIVEDRQDPLKIGRVRVRVHGIHTEKKGDISTPDLPWAQVVLPTTSAGLSGFGTQHGLVEGSTVLLFFRDEGECQQPVVIGSTVGIPDEGYIKNLKQESMPRPDGVGMGFNDPRRLTTDAYDGTPDGKNPTHSSKRGFGLTTALDTAPKIYASRDVSHIGKGSSITEPTLTKSDLPYYPLYTGKTDVSKLAGTDSKSLHSGRDILKSNGVLFLGTPEDKESVVGSLDEEGNIKSPAKPVYPYNKVIQSESGHVIEMDDTPSVERLAIEHRSGTFQEIHPDGSQVTRVVNDNYTIICRDEEVHIGGKVNIKVLGDANIETVGKLNIKSFSDGVIDVNGNLDIKAGNELTISAAKHVKVRTPKFKPNS